jgi:predicted Zn-dependent protease
VSRGPDPVVWVAAVFLVLAAALGALYLLDDPAAFETLSGAGSDEPEAARAATRGWVPEDAEEAISPADAAREAPPEGPACDPRGNLVDLAKGAAATFESELRRATALSDADETAIGLRLEREASRASIFAGKWDLPADRDRYAPYLQALVDALVPLVSRSGLRYRVHIIREKDFNAFAMAGGVLAVTTGVLEGPEAVRDEAELVAVLGHELAHVELRHAAAAYQYVRAVLGDGLDEAAIIPRLFTIPISTEHEHEADARGLALAAAAGYDPFAGPRLWSRRVRVEAPDADHPSGGLAGAVGDLLGAAEQVLHTHPPARQRCGRTRDVARRLAQTAEVDRWYRGQTNLRDRVPGPQDPH